MKVVNHKLCARSWRVKPITPLPRKDRTHELETWLAMTLAERLKWSKVMFLLKINTLAEEKFPKFQGFPDTRPTNARPREQTTLSLS